MAVQAQDPRGFRLALRARTEGVTAADVDAALTTDRSLVVSWLNRGTLHLVRSADYWWLHPLVTPQLASGNARRLREEGVSAAQAERGVEAVVREVAQHGPRSRAQLRSALASAGVPTAGQALVHVLFAATLRGHIVRGPLRDGDHCFVDVQQWLGTPPEPLPRTQALALLARRYLAGHGPAQAADLAKWAGVLLRDARSGLTAIAEELVEYPGGVVDLAERGAARSLPAPVLLGPFDPLLHGWVSREFVVGEHRGIVTSNGLFRAFALVAGRAVASWGLSDGKLTLRPLSPIGRSDLRTLEADAADVRRYLGITEGSFVVQS